MIGIFPIYQQWIHWERSQSNNNFTIGSNDTNKTKCSRINGRNPTKRKDVFSNENNETLKIQAEETIRK